MSNIFISYSQQDEDWKNRVAKQIGVLARAGLDSWDDRRIAAGDDWHPKIQQAIERCDVAVLLISADFLTSSFILDTEIPRLLQRRQEQGIRVIPLIVRPCTWQRIDWLEGIQARPQDGKPLSGMSPHDAEAALSRLADEIADLLLAPPSNASFMPPPRPGTPSSAASIWQEKLEFLRQQEAICADPAQKFALKKQIEEAEAKLKALS